MNTAITNASGNRRLILEVLFGLPALILLGKLPLLPTSALFTNAFALTDVSVHIQKHLEYVMFIPLSAVVVVLFRLTLGFHVFGLFRPILLGIAFRITGLQRGVLFLSLIMMCIVLVRPVLRVARLHSYAREAVALGAVVVLMLITVAASSRTHETSMLSVARFPIISLCLISEHFAKALYDHGARHAIGRGAMTIFVGVVICVLGSIPGLMHLFLRFPELLIAQIGCVVAIAEFLNVRLFERNKAEQVPPQMFQEYASEVVK